jgi:sugar O-acyltransferase (sialic acid O-acetyltransferase NeuD family)
MKNIIIIGSGGFGREVEMLINQINSFSPTWNLLGFVDDITEQGVQVGSSKVLGNIDYVNALSNVSVVLAVANPALKKSIINRINSSIEFATLIHPTVIYGDRVSIGYGAIICAGTIITTDVSIGNHVILNLMCTVGHDTVIADLCSFMPSVNISGEVSIGQGVYVGTGAKIINQLTIGNGAIIGAGAVVSKSIPENCTAVGIPAKPIKFHS